MKKKAQVANRWEHESGIAPPDVARISSDFVHDAPIFVKKALAMAFGVGSAKVIMAFDPGSAMTITALGFLMVTDFLTTIGFNVLNAFVIGVNAGELFSTKYRFRGAGISQGDGKLANVAMPLSVAKFLANL